MKEWVTPWGVLFCLSQFNHGSKYDKVRVRHFPNGKIHIFYNFRKTCNVLVFVPFFGLHLHFQAIFISLLYSFLAYIPFWGSLQLWAHILHVGFKNYRLNIVFTPKNSVDFRQKSICVIRCSQGISLNVTNSSHRIVNHG